METIWDRILYSNLIKLNAIVALHHKNHQKEFTRCITVTCKELICTDLHRLIDGMLPFEYYEFSNFTGEQKLQYFKRQIIDNLILHNNKTVKKSTYYIFENYTLNSKLDIVFFEDNLYYKGFVYGLEIIQSSIKKTHKVVDTVYHEDEGNIDFIGTIDECQEYFNKQCLFSPSNIFMLRVEELTDEEMKIHNKK